MRRLLFAILFVALLSASARATDLFTDLDLVTEELRSPDPVRRRGAVERLDAFGGAARPLLLAAFDDGDAEVRARAIASVGHHRFLDAIPRLWTFLGDGEPRIRARAAQAIGEIEVAGSKSLARSTEALERAALDRTPEVRLEAVAALSRLPLPARKASSSALVIRLEDENAEIRKRAAEGLGLPQNSPAVVPLLGRLEDPSREVRIAILQALGEIGDARAASGMIRLLRDGVEEVRAEAVLALGRLHAHAAVGPLRDLMARGPETLSGRAAFALGQIAASRIPSQASKEGSPPSPDEIGDSAISALVTALGRDETRQAAAEALHTVGREAIPALIARFSRSGEVERATLLQLFTGLPDQRSVPLLIEELALGRSSRPKVTAALAAIAKGRSASAAPPRSFTDPAPPELIALADLTQDPDVAVRRAAIRGLIGADDRRIAWMLAEATSDSDREIRVTAIEALGRLNDPRSLPRLGAAAKSPDWETARAAVQAIGAHPDPRTTPLLLEALARPEPTVRRAAADALERAADPNTKSALLQLAHLGSEEHRDEALSALGGVVRARPDPVVRELCLGIAESKASSEALAAVDVLGAMRDPASLPRLLRLLGRSGSGPQLRSRIVSVLGALPDADAVASALLDRLKNDPDSGVRAEAAWALGKHRASTTESALVAALSGSPSAVRANAAGALVRLGRGAEALKRLVADDDPAVSANAALGPRKPAVGDDWIALRVVDFDGAPLADAAYRLLLPGGLVKVGRTDDRGVVREERLPSGACQLELVSAPRP